MNNREDDFDNSFIQLMGNEGNYSNDPIDSGGETIYGITKRDYPNDFQLIYDLYKRDLKELALDRAKRFYRKQFWNDLYQQIPDSSLAFKIFDLSVNRGKRTAIKLLQDTLFFDFGKTLGRDGIFGTQTLEIIKSVANQDLLYDKYIERNEASYRKLSTFWRFGKGWILRLKRKVYV